jgi:hypothetical protein
MTPALSILPFSPAVAMLDVVTWLARRLGRRCCAGPQPPGVQKQLKALQDLAGGLALLAPHQADETFLAKAIPQVNALMTSAASGGASDMPSWRKGCRARCPEDGCVCASQIFAICSGMIGSAGF